jgi:predicted nucleic acid-binding Zn ribbon protein
MIIVSLFLPWWTFIFISTVGSAFASLWLFGGFSVGSIAGYGVTFAGLTSEFLVAAVPVILGGALGIVSTRDRRFSLAGGALGLIGALIFLVRLDSILGGAYPGNIFFGVQSAAGASLFWFLSFGFWMAIASSIIMLVAKPTVPGVKAPPVEPAAAPPAEGAPPGILAAKVQYCPNCGAPLEPGARFCIRCGKSVGKGRIRKKRKMVKKKRVRKKRVKKKRAVKRKRIKKKRRRKAKTRR